MEPQLNSDKKSFFRSKLFFMVVGTIIIITLAGAGYFIYFQKDSPQKPLENKTKATKKADTAKKPSATQQTSTTATATNTAGSLISKMDQVNIDQISGAVTEINSTVSSFNSAGRQR